ncbi:MAG: hydrogenase maturation nickel metallochaperone HypA [Pseudomonadota bacterium]
MHELSLIQSVLDITVEHAEKHQCERVLSLKLSFGRLANIEPGSLRFAFEVQSRGTKAEGATLELAMLPVIIHCFSCGKNSELNEYASTCPCCNSTEVTLSGGMEELKFLEMEAE